MEDPNDSIDEEKILKAAKSHQNFAGPLQIFLTNLKLCKHKPDLSKGEFSMWNDVKAGPVYLSWAIWILSF